MDRLFLAMWGINGLEYLADVTAHERSQLFNTIAGKDHTNLANLHNMILKARSDPAMQYEIYSFYCNPDISQGQLVQLFSSNKDGLVALIKQQGTCLL